MTQSRNHVASLLAIAFGMFAAAPAQAASLQPVSNWGASGVPTYISMYIYVPDKPAANPPILVVSHFCGGSASQVFGQAQTGGIVSAADKYGFIMIFPQTTNAASSAKCWDVGSTASLTHDGGGDTQAVAQMVKYTITTYKANPERVYATGDSSGGMMTEALLAVYPDIFKAGSAFAGVPAGCWSLGWTAASNWGGTCAGSGNPATSSVNQTAQQWGDKVRAMYPTYPASGHRPRAQLIHGDQDQYVAYTNLREGIKEWTNVLGLSTNPTSTDTGLTLGTHQATRQRWQNACGYVVLEAITSIGGDHGPSDALFDSSNVIPFLGLDKTDAVDPEVAKCSAGGGAGTGGSTSAGGSTSTGGSTTVGGTSGNGGTTSTGGAKASGGSTSAAGSNASGGSPSTGGAKASGGMLNTGGSVVSAAGGNSATGGVTNAGGANTTGGMLGAGGLNGNGGSTNAMGGSNTTSTSLVTGGAATATSTTSMGGQSSGTNSGAATPADDGSCSCRTVGTGNSGRGALGGFLLAALVTMMGGRRRRS